jgi:hypothetical protein
MKLQDCSIAGLQEGKAGKKTQRNEGMRGAADMRSEAPLDPFCNPAILQFCNF